MTSQRVSHPAETIAPDAQFSAHVNLSWMEALDVDSGRLYYVRIQEAATTNEQGDVRPTGETSWDPPEGFMVRRELCEALSAALISSRANGSTTTDEESFLAKVRARFPPPSASTSVEREMAELRRRVKELEEANATLKQQTNTRVGSTDSGKSLGTRSPSSRFEGVSVKEPPPPPVWMTVKHLSSVMSADL